MLKGIANRAIGGAGGGQKRQKKEGKKLSKTR